MKVYLLDAYGRGSRYFYDEKSLISYLNRDKTAHNPLHLYTVTVIEAQVDETVDGSSYLERFEKQTREKNIRESKLNSVLGDEFTLKVDKLISLVKESAANGIRKQKFLEALELVPVEKKEFSKFVTGWSDYLLYQVDSSVEYYKALLAVHNFRKINDRYTMVMYDSRGNERYNSGLTKDINKQNFLIAKSK